MTEELGPFTMNAGIVTYVSSGPTVLVVPDRFPWRDHRTMREVNVTAYLELHEAHLDDFDRRKLHWLRELASRNNPQLTPRPPDATA